jgi:hypothetical protein
VASPVFPVKSGSPFNEAMMEKQPGETGKTLGKFGGSASSGEQFCSDAGRPGTCLSLSASQLPVTQEGANSPGCHVRIRWHEGSSVNNSTLSSTDLSSRLSLKTDTVRK